MSLLTRTDSAVSGGSIESFNSEDLEEDASTYSVAPHDIFGEAAGLGKVIVAKTGDLLPKDTKYMSRKGGTVGVKFRCEIWLQIINNLVYFLFVRINEDLSVDILKVQSFNNRKRKSGEQQPCGSSKSPRTSTPVRNIMDKSELNYINESSLDLEEETEEAGSDSGVTSALDLTGNEVSSSRGSLMKSKKLWLTQLSDKFVETVIQGLEACKRMMVKKSIEERKKLSPQENKAVIAAVNHEIFKFIGAQRPDMNLCR